MHQVSNARPCVTQKRLFEGANVTLPRIYDRKGSQREEVKVSLLGLRHGRSSLSSQTPHYAYASNNAVPVTTHQHLGISTRSSGIWLFSVKPLMKRHLCCNLHSI